MPEMTAAQAKALREAFPDAAVGKLPKPYRADSQRGNCNECGGYHGLPAVHLDYVGHAATTDRLLAVDPNWTWEPMATDEAGLPALDRKGNLWIRLTVCGVTRIGVGDGKSAKECIGDAIRNAAMRFGVALDLWAKEDLHEIQAAQNEAPAQQPSAAATTDVEADLGASTLDPSSALAKRMFALMDDLGISERPDRLLYVSDTVGRQVGSSAEMTVADAEAVVASLERDKQPVEQDGVQS